MRISGKLALGTALVFAASACAQEPEENQVMAVENLQPAANDSTPVEGPAVSDNVAMPTAAPPAAEEAAEPPVEARRKAPPPPPPPKASEPEPGPDPHAGHDMNNMVHD